MKNYRLVLLFIAAVLIAWVAIIIASGAGWNPIGIRWDFSNTGAFGDSFGPLSATMAAAAAVSALLAWNIQRNEVLRLRSNDEQAKNDLEINRDDQTFFNLLRMFQDVVAATDIQRSDGPDKRGQDSFAFILDRVSARLEHGREQAYTVIFNKYINDLGHYFRILYNIIAFIDRSRLPDKYFYVKVVRSLLSNAEIALIGLNCIYGEGLTKFKPLVEKYALLKNLSPSLIEKYQFKSHFAAGAFVRTD
ncbi:putative phage abortive infection protein [Sphingomonas sp. MMS24-J45]|uniref:putative phage abortive infection protein n=1 Tax=Sphingomonas sp. MMS24-J45 TaxID=3238806 RepID=UPI00385072A5